MKKVIASKLTGAALDWAVAQCDGKSEDCEVHAGNVLYGRITSGYIHYRPSTNWAQGGPIIERECISTVNAKNDGVWSAYPYHKDTKISLSLGKAGSTPLIAAMRCYVVSKMGDEIEIPEELL